MHSRQPTANSVRLTLNVKTQRSETKLFCEPDGTLTIHVAAPPVKGRANHEIVRWLSKTLRTPSSNVRLVAGLYSNVKIIEIAGMTEAEIAPILGIKHKTSNEVPNFHSKR